MGILFLYQYINKFWSFFCGIFVECSCGGGSFSGFCGDFLQKHNGFIYTMHVHITFNLIQTHKPIIIHTCAHKLKIQTGPYRSQLPYELQKYCILG